MYSPIELPTNLPLPVADVVRTAIDPRLADVHSMLRLPLAEEGFEAGCNLSIVDVLFGVIEGVSTVLSPRHGQATETFRQCVSHHYNSELEGPAGGLPSGDLSNVLWLKFRNPMQHTLGVALRQPDKQGIRELYSYGENLLVFRDKASLTENQLVELERNLDWPTMLNRPTLTRTQEGLLLSVEAFYVGTRRLIRSVLSAQNEMNFAADALARGRSTTGRLDYSTQQTTMVNSGTTLTNSISAPLVWEDNLKR
jgi:hypothetical protein